MQPVLDAIDSDEFILRRIHKSHYDSEQPLPVLPAGFRPSKSDGTGLSVFRERYISAAAVAAAGRSLGEYYVARLEVRALFQWNLSVIPDENPGTLPGHALIPELCLSAYQHNKQRLRSICLELARLASQAVVHFAER
jgi:hypothetical protein